MLSESISFRTLIYGKELSFINYMILDEMKPFFSLILQSMKFCSVFSCLSLTQRELVEQLVIENKHVRFT